MPWAPYTRGGGGVLEERSPPPPPAHPWCRGTMEGLLLTRRQPDSCRHESLPFVYLFPVLFADSEPRRAGVLKFVPYRLARGPMQIGRVVATPSPPPPCPAVVALGVRGVLLVVAAASSLATVCRVYTRRDAAQLKFMRARYVLAIFWKRAPAQERDACMVVYVWESPLCGGLCCSTV